ncbi:MAG TPA: hypothetical protein PKV13_09385 [Propionicimonas sp.]|nr:hypothetical protein [Propionicimonas sp.]HRA06817.1 hypothetical protein [Propionicimonas sp.]
MPISLLPFTTSALATHFNGADAKTATLLFLPYLALTGDSEAESGPITTRLSRLPIRAVAPSSKGPAALDSLRSLLASPNLRGVPVTRSGIPFRG